MMNDKKIEFTIEEAKELDDILTEFYKCVCDEMIAKKNFTIESVEADAIEWLSYLLKTVKDFKVFTEKSDVKKDLEIRATNKTKFNDSEKEKIFNILVKYYIFVVKILDKRENVTKEKVSNLAKDLLKVYLRMEAYKELID